MATKAVRETNGILCPLTSVAGLEDCNPIPTARGSRRQLWRREKVHPVHATSRPPPACFPRLTCPSGARDWWRPVPGSLTRPHAHTHVLSVLLHVRQRTLIMHKHVHTNVRMKKKPIYTCARIHTYIVINVLAFTGHTHTYLYSHLCAVQDCACALGDVWYIVYRE